MLIRKVTSNEVQIRPTSEKEEATCRTILQGKTRVAIQRTRSNSLRCTPTNILVFEHDELKVIEYDGYVQVRALTKDAEELLYNILMLGGFAVIEKIKTEDGSFLRSVGTNPETMNPWKFEADLPRADMTRGDDEKE